MKQGIKTAEKFDLLSLWSIKVKPNKQGVYSWFALKHKNEMINREPYHMYLDPKEADDRYDQFSDLMQTAKSAQKLGIETDNIKM